MPGNGNNVIICGRIPGITFYSNLPHRNVHAICLMSPCVCIFAFVGVGGRVVDVYNNKPQTRNSRGMEEQVRSNEVSRNVLRLAKWRAHNSLCNLTTHRHPSIHPLDYMNTIKLCNHCSRAIMPLLSVQGMPLSNSQLIILFQWWW